MTDHLTEQFVLANCIETLDKIESHLDRIAVAHERIATAHEQGAKDLDFTFSHHLRDMVKAQEKHLSNLDSRTAEFHERICGIVGEVGIDLTHVVKTKLNAKAK